MVSVEKSVKATVYLVRHCTFDFSKTKMPGRLPVPLSNEGVTQAIKLQKYFQDKNIKFIFSSAVIRCKQTAEIISDGKIPIKYDLRLLETFSCYQGYWGNDRKEFYNHRKDLGGETNKEIQSRMISFWNEVALKSKVNIVVCSHGDPIDFLYEYLVHLPLDPEPVPFKEWPITFHYQPKGSIRPIYIFFNKTYKLGEIIKQEDLP